MLFSAKPLAAQETNFELDLIIKPSDPVHNSLGTLIEQSLIPLLIDVEVDGVPDLQYHEHINRREFDLILFPHEEAKSLYPPIWSAYGSESYTGRVIYGMEDTNIMQAAGVNVTVMDHLIASYDHATSQSEKIGAAYAFQEYYNNKVLLDVPLYSPSTSILYWSNLDGFDPQEDLMGSLFLGAKWNGNHEERENLERTTEELHLKVKGFENLVNPLFYRTRSHWQISEGLFPSLIMMDKNRNPHPDLAITMNQSTNVDGEHIFTFSLRDDAFWSDGGSVDAYDIKFTYDLLSFDWVGASDERDWENFKEVRIHNATSLEVVFVDTRIENLSKLAITHILPEHELNNSASLDGELIHPYLGDDPTVLPRWKQFLSSPTTSGPFTYNQIESAETFLTVLDANDEYWFPNEHDSPQHIFDLSSSQSTEPYYFTTDSLEIKRLIYHPKEFDNLEETVYRDLEFQKFQSAIYDIIEFQFFLQDQEVREDPRWSIASVPVSGSGVVILFNLEKPELRSLDVREAIYKAINRADIQSVFGYGWRSQKTPVSSYYPEFYNTGVEINEDNQAAKNIFRNLGYGVLDENADQGGIDYPWEQLVLEPYLIFISLPVLALLNRIRMSRD